MFWYAAAAIGASAISGWVEGNNAKRDAEKHNDALDARKAWLLEEKIMSKRVFELQTFSKYYEEHSAGAARIASAAQLGQSSTSASAINSLSRSLMKRDMQLDDLRLKHELKTIDQDIKTLDFERRDPEGERTAARWGGILKGAGTAAQIFAYSNTGGGSTGGTGGTGNTGGTGSA